MFYQEPGLLGSSMNVRSVLSSLIFSFVDVLVIIFRMHSSSDFIQNVFPSPLMHVSFVRCFVFCTMLPSCAAVFIASDAWICARPLERCCKTLLLLCLAVGVFLERYVVVLLTFVLCLTPSPFFFFAFPRLHVAAVFERTAERQ